MSNSSRMRELWRQQQLLAGVFAQTDEPPPGVGSGWNRGVAVYRANAASHAADVLRARYPTVLAMLGGRALDRLAAVHWCECPPRHGDLGLFGDDFPDWLGRRNDLAEWPWLRDCARLDDACWQLGFAPPAGLTDEHLRRLAEQDPDALALRLAPGTRLLSSEWPVVQLRALHAVSAPDVDAILEALRMGAQTAWVWRQGFEVRCIALNPHQLRWMQALRGSSTLGAALGTVDDAFDVAAWFTEAVRAGWIDGIDLITT